MIKISKITDYGIVLLTHCTRHGADKLWTAKGLSEATKIPLPTVGKILKILSRGGILSSVRGTRGGYKLKFSPFQVNVAQVIQVLEGQLAITDCSQKGNHSCEIFSVCPNKSNWQKINSVVYRSLQSLSLADMSRPFLEVPFEVQKV